jgi:hypothetical protein
MFIQNPISINKMVIYDWLCTQEPGVMTIMEFDECFEELIMNDGNKYKMMLKPNPKPEITCMAGDNWNPSQLVVFNSRKIICAFFIFYMRELQERICSVINNRTILYTGMSVEAFSDKIDEKLSGYTRHELLKNHVFVEIDCSKFDKSQGRLHLLLECFVMRKFGVPERLIEIWYYIHAETFIKDNTQDFSLRVNFQRKSGDPFTWLGNTLISAFLIYSVVMPEDVTLMALSGDDDLAVLKSLSFDFQEFQKQVTVIETLFNISLKLFIYDYPSFCSKFIIDVDGRWLAIPDPLKALVKLGRYDIANEEHLQEYFISMCDNLKVLRDARIWSELSRAVICRYRIKQDLSYLFMALGSVTTDFGSFKELFEIVGELNPNVHKLRDL